MKIHWNKILLILALSLLPCTLLSCDWLLNPPKQQDTISPQIPVWSKSLTGGEQISGLCPPLIYENNVICLGSRDKKPIIRMFDKKTGTMIWEWNEVASSANFVVKRVYIYQNALVINNAPHIYCIDTKTGKSLWYQRINEPINPEVKGLKELFFIGTDNSIIVGNAFNSVTEKLAYGNQPSLFRNPIWYYSQQSLDTLLIGGGRTYQNDSDYYRTYLTLYNWNKRQTVYQLLQVEGRSSPDLGFPGPGQSVVLGNRVCIDIGRSIQCNDILTGKLIWRRKFLGSFYFSSIIAADNRIFGNSDDEGIMYALNPDTGDIIWQEQTSSASGDMLYMNGVIYIVGLGDGKLHAIDAQTGKHIWKFRSPDYESSNTNSSFEDAVTGDGQYIYVRSRLNLYCFKAAK